jgi:anti-anti-sigma factor
MPSSVSTLPVDGIARGDHVCAVLDGQAVQEELVTEFVGAGLRRHERVAYFAGDSSPERVLGMLHAGGISTAEPLAQGQLLVVPAEDGYLSEGPFDPGRRVAGLNAAIDAALADGYSGLRATGEQWSTRELPREELLVEYETKVGKLCAARSAMGLCQYDSRRCERQLLDTMQELHGHVARNPLVSANQLLRVVPLSADAHGNSWLRITGEADLSNSALLLAALEDGGCGDVHLDLRRLRFMDLKGVEVLQQLTDALRRSQRKLVLHNAPATLRRIVEIVGGCLPDMEISAP